MHRFIIARHSPATLCLLCASDALRSLDEGLAGLNLRDSHRTVGRLALISVPGMNLRASCRRNCTAQPLSRSGLPTPQFRLSHLFCNQIIVEPTDRGTCSMSDLYLSLNNQYGLFATFLTAIAEIKRYPGLPKLHSSRA